MTDTLEIIVDSPVQELEGLVHMTPSFGTTPVLPTRSRPPSGLMKFEWEGYEAIITCVVIEWNDRRWNFPMQPIIRLRRIDHITIAVSMVHLQDPSFHIKDVS